MKGHKESKKHELMFKLRTFSFLSSAVVACTMSSPSLAAQYLFNFDQPTFTDPAFSYVGSGKITTSDTPDSSGGYLITALSGQVNGTAINGLYAPGEYFGNDNLLFVGRETLLDGNGVSFTAGDLSYNFYFYTDNPDTGDGEYLIYPLRAGYGTFTIEAVSGAVPEPSTWALMLVGFGAVGYSLRRKRTRVRVAYA